MENQKEQLSRRWDKGLSDLTIKTSAGIVTGIVLSVLLFKRRTWPVILGGSFGAGMAYADWARCLPLLILGASMLGALVDSLPQQVRCKHALNSL